VEVAGLTRRCVVGPGLADFLGRDELIGREVSLSGARCEVVGVLDYARSRPAGRFNDAAIAPFLAARRYFVEPTPGVEAGPRDADWLSFFMEPLTDMELTRYRADRLLRKAAGVPLSRASPYQYDNAEAAVRDQLQQRDALSRLLWTVTLAALLTSLLGYGGIAFAATAARRREVALRLAMGGTQRAVLGQITLEHALVGVFGSIAGLVVGLAGAWAASVVWDWPVRLSLWAAIGSILLGCVIGTTLGLFAARRAAQTPPALAAKG
jgi:putative ABC transport system permease protein